jgi:hypothetical protein
VRLLRSTPPEELRLREEPLRVPLLRELLPPERLWLDLLPEELRLRELLPDEELRLRERPLDERALLPELRELDDFDPLLREDPEPERLLDPELLRARPALLRALDAPRDPCRATR